MDWFRSWHGAPTDNKWLLIARRANTAPGIVSAVAWALLDYASQNADRGSIAGFDVEVYATFSGFDEAVITAVLAALQEKGVIAPDGRWAAWEKRQIKREDNSTERVRQLRERERLQREANAASQDVTQGNAEKRNETPGNSRGEERRGEEKRTEDDAAPDPIRRAITNAYDACGLMVTRTHIDKHLETIQRTGLPAWQLGFAEAHRVGKSNFPAYVARCAESAMLAEQQRANGNGTHAPEIAAEVYA